MPLAVIESVPLSLRTPSGRIITLTPDEEEAAFKAALKRSVEEAALSSMTGNIHKRDALYHALGLAGGIALGGLILALLGAGRR
jgi:hypothetical protein